MPVEADAAIHFDQNYKLGGRGKVSIVRYIFALE